MGWCDNGTLRKMKSWGVVFKGVGAYLPGAPISNKDLHERHGLVFDLEKHEATTGIRTRHWAGAGEATSHIAAGAAKEALLRAGVRAEDLDRIILGTSSADHTNLAAACRVQQLIGATCPASDITAACAGFIFALEQGANLVRTGAQRVLVIGADTKSRFIRSNDTVFGPIFSDGGGAVVLVPTDREGEGLLDIQLWADGTGFETLYVPAGGSMMPASKETVEGNLHGTMATMPGKELALGAAAKMDERYAAARLTGSFVSMSISTSGCSDKVFAFAAFGAAGCWGCFAGASAASFLAGFSTCCT